MIGHAHPSIARIQSVTAEAFGIAVGDMKSRRHIIRFARPRQVAMFFARERTPYSLPQIGRMFDRDHSTVLHAIGRVQELTAADPDFAAKVRECGAALDPGGG